jgi:nucleotide-binding universal stress UspA family protein
VQDSSTVQAGPGLRILLAHDLTAAAEPAVSLVRDGTWPAGSSVRLVSSPVGIGPGHSSFANVPDVRAYAAQIRDLILSEHERVAAELRRAGLAVDTELAAGPPEDVIIQRAATLGSDLIVLGARRQGALEATLLGSVSRAVVDRAPCSVLVARGGSAARVLLATDGSAESTLATTIVGTWPLFAGSKVRLVGIGAAPSRYAGIVLSAQELDAAYRSTTAAAIDQIRSVVREAAAALSANDRIVESDVRLGALSGQVLAAAEEWPPDVVVFGSDAQPFLHRLVLGTAARKVLDAVPSSVLIVRGPTPA